MAHQRIFSLAVPVVAAAALLFAAGPVSAGKGGGGGGGHPGGGGGYRGGGYGGYRGGYGGYGYRGYGGFGVGVYLGGYGYPYYGYGYGVPYGGYASDYYAPAPPVYVTPPAAMPPVATPGYQLGGDAPPDNTAHITVRAPADADVRFGQGKTQQSGAVREFASPPLSPGKDYTYEIKARWTVGGKEVVQTRQVDVGAGTYKVVDFTKPVAEGVEAPKPK